MIKNAKVNKVGKMAEMPFFSGKKKLVFTVILALIPVFMILVLEISLRISGYGSNLDLFLKSKDYLGYFELNQDVTKRFFTQNKGTSPSNDLFLIQKPGNCYRIFVMGCSTTRGFPYTMGTSFSRILNYRLQDAFPDKKIEVVNTSMAAVNSYTQLDFIDEILDMKPDAILIYTGHNEYYGALGVASVENGGNVRLIKRLHLALIQFRTYQVVQKVVGAIAGHFVTDTSSPTATLMERIVKDKSIAYQSESYKAGIEQFRVNMDNVVHKIKDKKVPLIFSEAVSNISGNPPFNSAKAEGYPIASETYEKARKFESDGSYDEARKLYYLAKDLDGIRFRAPEDINAVIRSIGKKYAIPVLDMKAVFESASPNGIIGNSLMTEHLHPNIDGYFLMADAFFKEMQRDRFISGTWDNSKIKPSAYYRSNWGFTTLDSLKADLNIKALKSGWPFKPDSVENKFIFTYKPVSMVDSIAHMCVLYDNVSIGDKHRDLAKIYLSRGDKRNAFKEYYALIKFTPYNTYLYYEALKLLNEMGDYPRALDIMLSMPNYDTIYSVNEQIGKIYQHLGEHKKALQSFGRARQLIAKNDNLEALLIAEYNSCEALNDQLMAAKVLKEIRQINPGFELGDAKKKEVVVYLDNEVRDLIQNALKEAKLQNYNGAISLLEKSLRIKETAFALQLMGSIYIQMKDNRALSILERAHVIDPNDLKTINNLFVSYLQNKNFGMASKMLDEYKVLSPDQERVKMLTNSLNEEMSQNK